jgi:Fic family protein
VKDALARAAWGSTAIEGCTLSLEAIRGLLEGKEALGYPDRHVRMAQNYLNALAWIQKREKATAVLEKDVLQLHRIISRDAVDEGPVGAYRKIDVRAGLHVCPPWRRAPQLTRDLLAWLNGPAAELPAVFSSAILHLRFVEIHPFRDGNGRVGRALATWQLYRMGFDTMHVFALDEVLLENRALYIRSLHRVQVEGADLGGWLEFMAESILETLERVQKRVQALGVAANAPLSLTPRQEKLLHLLRERGPMGIRDLARALRVTPPGAHYALKPLLRGGVVQTIGSHKSTRYSLR